VVAIAKPESLYVTRDRRKRAEVKRSK
jgi:hypothetical protein